MDNVFSNIEELAGTIRGYVDTRIESMKLSVAEKSSNVIANLIAGVVVVIVFIFFIIFGSIALSFGLGEWIGKTWVGFLIVACMYLVIGIVVWIARGKLIRFPVMNAIIKQLFKNDDEED
jgi:uncharacterized membrane protein YqjE